MNRSSLLKGLGHAPILVKRKLLLRLILFIILFAPSLGTGAPYKLGDVFIGVSNGKVQHRDKTGQLIAVLDTLQGNATTGMAFDTVGNLYVTNFVAGNVRKFDNNGALIGSFGTGYSGYPESIVFDRNRNIYVGAVNGDNDIRKFDAQGNTLANFNVATEVRGADWIDLAADQCTLFYTSEGSNIKRFDV